MVVIGVASPTSIREAFGSLDMKMETEALRGCSVPVR